MDQLEQIILLEQKLNILKYTFNMDINHVSIIIPKIDKIDFHPIINILYCYLDKSELIFEIFNKYSVSELNYIAYLININKLTYSQCVDLFKMSELQIKLVFYFINIILVTFTEHTNKIHSIFEIIKSMDENTLVNLYTLRMKLNTAAKVKFMDICLIAKHFTKGEIEKFIFAMNKGNTYNDSYIFAVDLFFL
jgi:hypothetical protein